MVVLQVVFDCLIFVRHLDPGSHKVHSLCETALGLTPYLSREMAISLKRPYRL